jgi:hypothetical protein
MGMAELDKSVDFDYNSVELTDRLIQCAQHALPYFSTQVPVPCTYSLWSVERVWNSQGPADLQCALPFLFYSGNSILNLQQCGKLTDRLIYSVPNMPCPTFLLR